MKDYLNQIINITYKLLIAFLLFTISRLFFFIANYAAFSGNSISDLLKIFIIGIRFDATPIIEINFVFILLYALPVKFTQNPKFIDILNACFYSVTAILILFNFIDAEYFKFTGKRSTADLFNFILLSNDTIVLIPSFIKDYWYVPLSWIATVILGIYLWRKTPYKTLHYSINSLKKIVFSLTILLLFIGSLFIIARGTGYKPIRIITATRYTKSQNIPLLLNTPFCIIHTLNEKETITREYFKNEDLEKIYSPIHKYYSENKRLDNIIVIILESFSRDFIGSLTGTKGYTPYFDSIAKKGLIFENAFANGKKSIDAVPAIFAGLPALTDNPYISSQFSGNSLNPLPFLLRQNGYVTGFFHGGRNGTMGFEDFAHLAGFHKYFGMNEYKGEPAYDGSWGIYDEEFLKYTSNTLDTFTEPFLAGIFTLSSHHPYSVPVKYENKFPKNESNLLRSLRYADFSLGKFFETASKKSWYKNTLFILLADHTARDETNADDNSYSMFRIPILLFHPGDTNLTGKSFRITQQTDIMPTVLDYLGYDKPFLSFGYSVFSTDTSYALYYLGGIYKFIKGNYLLTFNGEGSISLHYTNSSFTEKENLLTKMPILAANMEKELKAIIQQYYTRLTQNRLIIKP